MTGELLDRAGILKHLKPFGLVIIGSLSISDEDSVPSHVNGLPTRGI
jgi:hypothetical protein